MLARGFEQGYTPSILLQFKDIFIFKDAFQSSCGKHCRPAFGSCQPRLEAGLWRSVKKAPLRSRPWELEETPLGLRLTLLYFLLFA